MSKKEKAILKKILMILRRRYGFLYSAAFFCLLTGAVSFWYFRTREFPPPPPETYQASRPPEVKGAKEELPLWFPADVPIIQPGTDLLSSSETKESRQVSLETNRGFAETIGFYLENMEKRGWKQREFKESEKNLLLVFSKDTRLVEVSLSEDFSANKTVVVITLSEF